MSETNTELTPTQKIEQYIDSISMDDVTRYKLYWGSIQPTTHHDYFKRWVFAFLSVHTSWQANVRAYSLIDKEKELSEKDQLRQLIIGSRAGLTNMRTEGIWKFKTDFYTNPEDWYKKDDESWLAFRDRTMNKCHGLGFAKSSFAIELCYPNNCEVACLDTHMLQLYGVKSSPTPSASKYKELENHWINKCKERDFPSFMIRNIYWDKVQAKRDTRYWSYVFEKSHEQTNQERTDLSTEVGQLQAE